MAGDTAHIFQQLTCRWVWLHGWTLADSLFQPTDYCSCCIGQETDCCRLKHCPERNFRSSRRPLAAALGADGSRKLLASQKFTEVKQVDPLGGGVYSLAGLKHFQLQPSSSISASWTLEIGLRSDGASLLRSKVMLQSRQNIGGWCMSK